MPQKFLLVLAAALALFIALKPVPHLSGQDFEVYHVAGVKAAAGKTVYDVPGLYQFKYGPATAALFGGTVARLPLESARPIFVALQAALWLALAALFLKEVGRTPRAALVTVLVSAVAIREELGLGQINALPFLLAYFAVVRVGARPGFLPACLAGALLGWAMQFKLYWLLGFGALLAPSLVTLSGLATGAALGSGLLGLLIVAAFHGWSFSVTEHQAWLTSLTASSADLMIGHHNVSLLGSSLKIFGAPGAAIWGGALTAFVILLLAAIAGRAPAFRRFAFVAACIPALNPLAWGYWAVLTLPAALIVAQEADWKRKGTWGWAALFTFSLNSQNAWPASRGAIAWTGLALGALSVWAWAEPALRAGTERWLALFGLNAPRKASGKRPSPTPGPSA